MKDFEEVYKIFYDDNNKVNNNYSNYYEMNLMELLKGKLFSLINNKIFYQNKMENNIKLLFAIMKILDKLNSKPVIFLENLEKNILNKEIIDEIYIYLSLKIVSLSNLNKDEILAHMANYIISNDRIIVIKKLNNKEQIIPLILTKINLNIKVDILYNNSKNNKYILKLLQDIQKEGLVKDYTFYKNDILNICEILNNIESGELSFQLINSIFNDDEKRNNFTNNLLILLFSNEKQKNYYIDKLQNFLKIIKDELCFITKLKFICENFYKNKNRNNKKLISYIENWINKGKLNEIQKIDKKEFNKIHSIIDNLDKKYIMKDSSLFIYRYYNEEKGRNNYLSFNREYNNKIKKTIFQILEGIVKMKK